MDGRKVKSRRKKRKDKTKQKLETSRPPITQTDTRILGAEKGRRRICKTVALDFPNLGKDAVIGFRSYRRLNPFSVYLMNLTVSAQKPECILLDSYCFAC